MSSEKGRKDLKKKINNNNNIKKKKEEKKTNKIFKLCHN
jgi:hypothetical protein